MNPIAAIAVVVVAFFFPAGLFLGSSDHSGAGMVAMGYLLFVLPPAFLVTIIAHLILLNTRFKNATAYVLVALVSSTLGMFVLM